ncbi:MAG: histidinol dehydrogenase [Gammaproteobacteria bacterium]|nr:histidinol dehydrogenase [Gammaproteobacteria bacterium]NNF48616.1 histidinol dehydrogenase [Woeseiaceae bacterium]
MKITAWNQLDDTQQQVLLLRPAVADDERIRAGTQAIVDEVRTDGDAALRRLTAEYDGAVLDDLRVADTEIDAAAAALSAEEIDAIDVAIENVRRFHEAQKPVGLRVETARGVVCERVTHALDAVGLYVPAGTAPLPSAAIMLAVPAAIAACPTRILCTPPRSDGSADPAVLVASSRAGVRDIFKIGGAQAIAAMAYGTATLPQVNKIFGPGNAWVTCAKSIVSADPDGAAIDMPAGPSEVLVIADAAASAEFVASDLLSQAEHGTDSQVVLVTTSSDLAADVSREVDVQLASLSRRAIAAGALENSRIIIVDDIDTAIAVSNAYAPEHLILQIEEPRRALPSLRNAGSVFVGPWTPESVGDYCSGTNHVLPTYGFARTYSGLGLDQFMRQMTIQELTRDGLEGLAGTVTCLAGLEGLDAHAAAVTRRLGGST